MQRFESTVPTLQLVSEGLHVGCTFKLLTSHQTNTEELSAIPGREVVFFFFFDFICILVEHVSLESRRGMPGSQGLREGLEKSSLDPSARSIE